MTQKKRSIGRIHKLYDKISRIVILYFVFSRVLYHKSNYTYLLASIIPELRNDSYLYRPSIRNKVIGHLIGIEAWHKMIFGKLSENYATTFLMACIAACYDNAIDLENFREWEAFDLFLNHIPEYLRNVDTTTAIYAGKTALIALKRSNPNYWESAWNYLVLINRATKDPFLEAGKAVPDEVRLRKSTYDKGGFSFLLFSLIENHKISNNAVELAYNFGAACQIADDIYDRIEDKEQGQCTLPLNHILRDIDRHMIYNATESLPRPHKIIPYALQNAWGIHLQDALKYYDSGKLNGLWRFNIGQIFFKLGIIIMPSLPFFICKKNLTQHPGQIST